MNSDIYFDKAPRCLYSHVNFGKKYIYLFVIGLDPSHFHGIGRK